MANTLRKAKPDQARDLSTSKRIEISYPLVDDKGNALGPPSGDWTEIVALLKKAYPTLNALEMSAPFVIIRMAKLPPTPWQFTIGGLPLRFTETEHGGHLNPGILGRGTHELNSINLRRGDVLSDQVFQQALAVMQTRDVKVFQIFCFDNYWSIVIPDGTDLRRVPRGLAGQSCCYKFESEMVSLEPAAVRAKVPRGIAFDDSDYATGSDALLRPGIMVTSSPWIASENGEPREIYKQTTSGILVVDDQGEPFVTVATHGFQTDGLIFHPNPISGSVVGKIVRSLPGTDISLAKLNTGLRYYNQTFGTDANPEGVEMIGLSPGYPPHLRRYDPLHMNNPYMGYSEGTVISVGLKLDTEGEINYIRHTWTIFENGSGPLDGSLGSPILDLQGSVIGLFRFKITGDDGCLAVSASELRRFGYEICNGERRF